MHTTFLFYSTTIRQNKYRDSLFKNLICLRKWNATYEVSYCSTEAKNSISHMLRTPKLNFIYTKQEIPLLNC